MDSGFNPNAENLREASPLLSPRQIRVAPTEFRAVDSVAIKVVKNVSQLAGVSME